MKLLIGILLAMLLVVSVSAEIVYSDQFYDNQNYTNQLVKNPTIGSVSFATAIGIKNTNELLMKQNELLQEQNNLTITQNEILRRICYPVETYFGIISQNFIRPDSPWRKDE